MNIDRCLRRFSHLALTVALVSLASAPLVATEVAVSVVSRHILEKALVESEIPSALAAYERMRAPAGYHLEALVIESTAQWTDDDSLTNVGIMIAAESGARASFLGILSPTGAYERTPIFRTTTIKRLDKEPSTMVRAQVLCLVKEGEGLSVSVAQKALPLPVPVNTPTPRAPLTLNATLRSNEKVDAIAFERENNDSKPDQLGFRYRVPGAALRVVHFDYRIQSEFLLRGEPARLRPMHFGLKTRAGDIIRPVATLGTAGVARNTVLNSVTGSAMWRHDPADGSCKGELRLVFVDAPGLEDAEIVFNSAPSDL